jgi:type II secretory pathway component PulK
MRDDGAALDVNRATEPMLTRLFAACGADALAATQGAQRVADWRDPDTDRRARGAERSDYLAMAARTLPADGPVRSVAELDEVAGLPAPAWACVRPLLQVGGAGRVNPQTAPVEVLAALPGFSLVTAQAVAASRSSGAAVRNYAELVAAVPGALRGDILRNAAELNGVLVFQSELVRITSVGQVTGSPVQVRAEALMRRNGGTVFVEWQEFR